MEPAEAAAEAKEHRDKGWNASAKTSGSAGRSAGSSSCARIRVLHEPPRPTSGSERSEAELQDAKLRFPPTLLADFCLPSVSLFDIDSRDRSKDSTVAPPVPMTDRDLLAVWQGHDGRQASRRGRHQGRLPAQDPKILVPQSSQNCERNPGSLGTPRAPYTAERTMLGECAVHRMLRLRRRYHRIVVVIVV